MGSKFCAYTGYKSSWLGPGPRIFPKLLKVTTTALGRINIKIIIYLNNMLLMGATMEQILLSKDTVISL